MEERLPEPNIIIILSTSFMVGLTGALMPGPLLALTVGQSIQHGFRAGPLIVLGHAILELSLIVALVLGLGQFFGNDIIFSIVGIIGGIVLVYMGMATVRQGWHRAGLPVATEQKSGGNALVLSGILVSVSNPYWIIWWATIGLTYLLWSARLGFWGLASFFTGHISSDLVWYSSVAFIVARGRKFINDSVYRWFLIICGLALVGLGVYFLISGISYLLSL
jgi:threonine/homoserine/homoserine lactone efflux protein